jgi:small subunit ribosomal protein S3
MGQKVNPHGLRVGVIKDWDSRWFANKSTFGDTLVEDYNVRNYIKKSLYDAGVPRIEIERFADKVKIHIHCARPGIVIGRGGAEIEKLRLAVEGMIKKPVAINIIEVKQPDLDAQLIAESIAKQLENRISFRRAMKQAIGKAMKLGARGIKTRVSGRLGGAEIARAESYHEGTIPLQTIRADIDYGTAEAHTTYGRLGVKVWVYKGEILKGEVPAEKKPQRRNRREGGNK